MSVGNPNPHIDRFEQTSYDWVEGFTVIGNYVWNPSLLQWEKQTGGGGVGTDVTVTNFPAKQAVTIADGDDVAQGSTDDAAWVSGDGTVISLLKAIAGLGAGGGLTDAELRASPVPVTGPLTNAELRAAPVVVTGVAGEGLATEATLLKVPGLSIPIYDYVSLTQNATQDIWEFKDGGAAGSTVAIVTVTFTDATKATISTVAKT